MEPSFWRERWDTGEIGFHEGVPNHLLVRFGALLPDGERALVPLCGKAVDLRWLMERGHPVVGVELSTTAVDAFFREQGLPQSVEARPPFTLHRGPDVDLYQGDFFDASPSLLGTFQAAYDRAALIALAPDTRARYAASMAALIAPGGRVLLITLGYDQALAPGPPWSVPTDVVRALFRKDFVVETLLSAPVEAPSRLRAAGATGAREHAFLLHRV